MRKTIGSLFLIALMLTNVAQADKSFSKEYKYNIDVISVYDGDTLTVESEVWPSMSINTNIRLYGIDTPEMSWRAKCLKEKTLAINAHNFLLDLVDRSIRLKHSMYITYIKEDKYAGRHVAKLIVNNKDVSETLINMGYAVEYFGTGTKYDWCK